MSLIETVSDFFSRNYLSEHEVVDPNTAALILKVEKPKKFLGERIKNRKERDVKLLQIQLDAIEALSLQNDPDAQNYLKNIFKEEDTTIYKPYTKSVAPQDVVVYYSAAEQLYIYRKAPNPLREKSQHTVPITVPGDPEPVDATDEERQKAQDAAERMPVRIAINRALKNAGIYSEES